MKSLAIVPFQIGIPSHEEEQEVSFCNCFFWFGKYNIIHNSFWFQLQKIPLNDASQESNIFNFIEDIEETTTIDENDKKQIDYRRHCVDIYNFYF